MHDMTDAMAFDGSDPRFPDLGAFPEQARIFSSAAILARRYRFATLGIEHLLHELLGEDGFRIMITYGGGNPDTCRGLLARAFRDHAEIQRRHPDSFTLSEVAAGLADGLSDFQGRVPNSEKLAIAADFYARVIAASDSSAIAEGAISDCGAGALLVEADDPDALDRSLERVTPAEGGAVRDGIEAFNDLFEDQAFFLDGGERDLSRVFSRDRPKPEEKTSGPGKPQPGQARVAPADAAPTARPVSRSGANGEDVAVAVNAALRDIGHAASQGEIDPVVGREREIDAVLSILRRRRKSSVILYGEAGVGKTAIAEGLALRLRQPGIEASLAQRPFYELALRDLVAGTKYRGEFEDRMRALLKRLTEERAIVFIDEFHGIVGAGASMGSPGLDGANMIKSELGRGKITVIGATTPQEMRELRKDGAFMRRFDTLNIREPSAQETLHILEGASWSYLEHHGLGDAPGVLQEIVRIADLYQPERRFPDKAFDLLDAACVVAVEAAADRRDLASMLLDIGHVHVAAVQLGLRMPRRPDPREALRLANLGEELSQLCQGQEDACGMIAQELCAAALNLGQAGVAGSILLTGAEGSGHAALARGAAGVMGLPHAHIDLGRIKEQSGIGGLVGFAGLPGRDQSGMLVDIADQHRGVVVHLDNIQDATPDIQELLAEICRKGVFRAADGRTLSLRHAVLIMSLRVELDGAGLSVGFATTGPAERSPAIAQERRLLIEPLRAEISTRCTLAPTEANAMREFVSGKIERLTVTLKEIGVSIDDRNEVLDRLAACGDLAAADAELRKLRDRALKSSLEEIAAICGDPAFSDDLNYA